MQMISWVQHSPCTRHARANTSYRLNRKFEIWTHGNHFYTTGEVGKYPNKLITSSWSSTRSSMEGDQNLQRTWRQSATQKWWKRPGFSELQKQVFKIKRPVLFKSVFDQSENHSEALKTSPLLWQFAQMFLTTYESCNNEVRPGTRKLRRQGQVFVWHMQWLSQLLGGLLVGDYMIAMDKTLSFWMQCMHMCILVTVSKDKKISGLLQKLCENFNDTYCFVQTFEKFC